jgi:phosphatidylserine/phosphatidylglycerophosphate/cardiolipin synthase-like enzyme
MPKRKAANVVTTNLNSVVSRPVPNTTQAKSRVYFDNIVENLIQHIVELKPDAIVGCFYFLTEPRILKLLTDNKIPVQIIVQKQELWRRDNKKSKTSKNGAFNKKDYIANKIRDAYNLLTPLNYQLDAVRCLGVNSSKSSNGTSLLHHKFFVFVKEQKPFAIVTGSFNLSTNASVNLENALYLEDATLARSYWDEWMNLLKHSEHLDFQNQEVKC